MGTAIYWCRPLARSRLTAAVVKSRVDDLSVTHSLMPAPVADSRVLQPNDAVGGTQAPQSLLFGIDGLGTIPPSGSHDADISWQLSSAMTSLAFLEDSNHGGLVSCWSTTPVARLNVVHNVCLWCGFLYGCVDRPSPRS